MYYTQPPKLTVFCQVIYTLLYPVLRLVGLSMASSRLYICSTLNTCSSFWCRLRVHAQWTIFASLCCTHKYQASRTTMDRRIGFFLSFHVLCKVCVWKSSCMLFDGKWVICVPVLIIEVPKCCVNLYMCLKHIHSTWVYVVCHSVYRNKYTFSLLLQLVQGQCFLNIHLHQYENMYNVEFRQDETKGPFCCCNQKGGHCRSNLQQLSTMFCDPEKLCDTYFVATLSDNQNFESWPKMLTSEVFEDSSKSTDVNYTFHFFLSKVPSESVCAYMIYACTVYLPFQRCIYRLLKFVWTYIYCRLHIIRM